MECKALFMTGERQVEVGTITLPELKENEVRVKNYVVGLCAWDSYLYRGISITEDYPFRFGHEGVGEVVSVGSEVKDFVPGDRVMVAGGNNLMSEYVNVPANSLAKIHTDVDNPAHWIGEPVACVVNSLGKVPIWPGASVALIGSGYMGLLYLQGLQHQLYGELTSFDLKEDRVELAKKFGVHNSFTVESNEGQAKIEELIAQGGVDIVIDCSGTNSGFALSNSLLKVHGTLIMFGWIRGEATFDGTPWHLNGITVHNTAPNSNRHFNDVLAPTEQLLRRGVFRTEDLVTHVYHYTKAQELFEIADKKSDGYIKGAISFV